MSRSRLHLDARQMIRPRIRWGVVAAFFALATTANAAAPDKAVQRYAQQHPGHQVEVIVQFKPGTSQQAARATVRAWRGKPGQALPIIRGLAVKMPARSAARLVRAHGVRAVTLNSSVASTAENRPEGGKLQTLFNKSIKADGFWKQSTGTGVGVAVIDTGITGDLPDFATSAADRTSRVIASVVTNPDATTAADTYGHGTHVAGIIAGNGAVRGKDSPLYSQYAGVAPEANLISIKASDDTGNSSVIDVINGVAFAIAHKDDLNIRVLNMSLQSSTPGSYKTDPLDAAVEAAWRAGIVVVVAAGNNGTNADAMQYAPSNDPYVITVGAVDPNGSGGSDDDVVPSWSSRGQTQDGFAKPDIYAPGKSIVSDLAPGSAFASLCPTCIVSGEYIRASGTSMAAPVVAGATALLLQSHPEWTPDQVKGAMLSAAHKNRDGNYEIDVNKAKDQKGDKLVSNVGLTPNPAAADMMADDSVDPTRSSWSKRSSWSRSSWSTASGDLAASWARSSWSCACSVSTGAEVDPTRSSWSRSSWSTIFGD
jgi:serine protease AprX